MFHGRVALRRKEWGGERGGGGREGEGEEKEGEKKRTTWNTLCREYRSRLTLKKRAEGKQSNLNKYKKFKYSYLHCVTRARMPHVSSRTTLPRNRASTFEQASIVTTNNSCLAAGANVSSFHQGISMIESHPRHPLLDCVSGSLFVVGEFRTLELSVFMAMDPSLNFVPVDKTRRPKAASKFLQEKVVLKVYGCR